MNVAILHDPTPPDARPDELDGWVQVEAVTAAVTRMGHAATAVPFSIDFNRTIDAIERYDADVVFNLVESVNGSGRLICLAPAVLEAVGRAYTGASSEATFSTSSKVLAKRILRAAGIATPEWVSTTSQADLAPFRPDRYLIKSVWEDASLGLGEDSVVDAPCADALRREIDARADHLGGEAFAERYIDGREFNLSLLATAKGCRVLPPAEIRFDEYPTDKLRIVDYAAKWAEDSFEYSHTPRRFDFPPEDATLVAKLERIAAQCWDVFGLRGYARVDFRVDESGRPWVLELNVNPCISPDAGFVAAAERAGLSFDDVVRMILDDAVRSCRARPPDPGHRGDKSARVV